MAVPANEELMTLPARINYALEIRDLSQSEVARRVPCSPQLISQLANGDTESSAKLPDIAKALSVRFDWLYYGQGEMDIGSELPFDEVMFLNCVEITIETALAGDKTLSPAEMARLALDIYETSIEDRETYTREQISAMAPLLVKHMSRR